LTDEFWEDFFKEIDEDETQAIAQIKPNRGEMNYATRSSKQPILQC
jgi:hypothetical protein